MSNEEKKDETPKDEEKGTDPRLLALWFLAPLILALAYAIFMNQK